MGTINLNKADDYNATDVKIFNDGNTGIVMGVGMRVAPKGADDKENAPDYKLFAKDKFGEVNEGFYYQDSEDDSGWKNYQAQRLIRLAQGVLGESFVFPEFSSPKEALDGVMKLVAPALKNTPFNVAVSYGTVKRSSLYLGFKSFGRFVENAELYPETKLTLDARYDQLTRPQPKTDDELKEDIGYDTAVSETTESGEDAPAWLSDDN